MHLHDLNGLIFYRENCKAMLKFSLVGDLPYFSLLKNGINEIFDFNSCAKMSDQDSI